MTGLSKEFLPPPRTPPPSSLPSEAENMAEGAETADGRHGTHRLLGPYPGDQTTVYDYDPSTHQTTGSHRVHRGSEDTGNE